MEWWMWIIAITWPFAGVAGFEFMVRSDAKIPGTPKLTRDRHLVQAVLSALAGWLLVFCMILASAPDNDII